MSYYEYGIDGSSSIQTTTDTALTIGTILDGQYLTRSGSTIIGAAGFTGPTGPNGTNGTNGTTGPTGPAGGASAVNYQAFYFNQTWTTPSNLVTNTSLRFPIDGGVFPLISQGNLSSVFANSSTSFYDIRYTGPTKTFNIIFKGYFRFTPSGTTNSTQIIWTLFADRPSPLTQITIPGSRQLVAINDPSAGRNSYVINMQGIVELNNASVVSPAYFYAPNGAGTNTMIVDEMYILFEQLD